jgi:hypothetical protein
LQQNRLQSYENLRRRANLEKKDNKKFGGFSENVYLCTRKRKSAAG